LFNVSYNKNALNVGPMLRYAALNSCCDKGSGNYRSKVQPM
jgi:hypothetical protein